MNQQLCVLLVDDPQSTAEARKTLEHRLAHLRLTEVSTRLELDAALAGPVHAVVTEDRLTWGDILGVIAAVRRRRPHCAIVVRTHAIDVRTAVRAMRAGADDCIPKDIARPELLVEALHAALDRAQQRHAQAEVESRYQWLWEHSPVAMAVTTTEGQIVDANPALARLSGYDPEALRALKIRSLYLRSEDRARFTDELRRHGHVDRFEVEMRRADGTSSSLQLSGTFTVARTGEPLFYGAAIDISERKRAEAALQKSEARWRSVAENPFDYVVIVDRQGTFQYLNHAVPGIAVEDLVGKVSLYDRTDPGDHRAIAEALSQVFDAGRPAYYEVYAPVVGRWFACVAGPLEENARVVAASIQTRDITDQKRGEERLAKQHQLLEATLAEREALLREIHHRVKNNLQVVVSLLSLQLGRSRSPQIQSWLRDSEVRIQAMARLHEKLSMADVARVDLGAYLQAIVEGVANSYKDARRVISASVSVSAAEARLPLDPALQCGLIVSELVTNAFKHAFRRRRRGVVDVTLGQRVPEELELVVRDDGVGLPATVGLGNTGGLGLSLVPGLVARLGGSARIVRGRGTEIHVRFPVSSDTDGALVTSLETTSAPGK